MPPSLGAWRHWVIYPPRTGLLGLSGRLAEMDVSALYALYLPVLRAMLGVYGVIVMHPYTMTDTGKAAVQAWRATHPRVDVSHDEPPADAEHIVPTYQQTPHAMVPAPEPSHPHGSWMILHEIGIDPSYLRANLHYHIIARGAIPEWISDEMVRQDWFVRRVRDIPDTDGAAGLLRYLLSHAGYDGHSQIYRYILPLDCRLRRTADGRHWELMRCASCGDAMRYAADGTPDDVRVCDLPESVVPVDDTAYVLGRNDTPSGRLYAKLRQLAYRIRDGRSAGRSDEEMNEGEKK